MAESARLGEHEQPPLASIGGSGTTRVSSSLLCIAIDMRYGRCGCRPAHKARNCQYCGCKYEYDDQNDQPVLFEHHHSPWKSYILILLSLLLWLVGAGNVFEARAIAGGMIVGRGHAPGGPVFTGDVGINKSAIAMRSHSAMCALFKHAY